MRRAGWTPDFAKRSQLIRGTAGTGGKRSGTAVQFAVPRPPNRRSRGPRGTAGRASRTRGKCNFAGSKSDRAPTDGTGAAETNAKLEAEQQGTSGPTSFLDGTC